MNPVMTIRIWTLGAFVESQVPKEHFNELLDWLVSHRSMPEKSETIPDLKPTLNDSESIQESPHQTLELSTMNNTAIHALLDIALNTPRETADVFLTLCPHIESVDIRIFAGGWSDNNTEPQFTMTETVTSAENLLTEVRAFLANINPAGALNAWTPESGEELAICRHCGEKESEHASGAQICIGGGGSQFSVAQVQRRGTASFYAHRR